MEPAQFSEMGGKSRESEHGRKGLNPQRVGAALFTARMQTIRAHMRPAYIELGIVTSEEAELVQEQAGN